MHKSLLAVVLAAISLGLGCQNNNTDPPFHEVLLAPNESVIYVYRLSNSYEGSAIDPPIVCDGKIIGYLRERTYLYAIVPPGAHIISSKTETESVVHVLTEAGKSYYVEGEVEMGFFEGRPRLTQVPEDIGKLAIVEMREYVPPSPRPVATPRWDVQR